MSCGKDRITAVDFRWSDGRRRATRFSGYIKTGQLLKHMVFGKILEAFKAADGTIFSGIQMLHLPPAPPAVRPWTFALLAGVGSDAGEILVRI